MAKGASKRKAARLAGKILPIVDQVQRDMGDAWRQDDQLLDRIFPVEPTSNPRSPYHNARIELFNENERYKRWKGISASPKPLSRLYRPLTNLMNRILFHYGISRTERLFIDTHVRRPSAASLSLGVSPGILLSGVGDEFAIMVSARPRANFPAGIAAIEVLLDTEDLMAARDRLAVHIHRIFQNQANRRFAYGLVITQNIFILYMFDHSGAVASQPCNYHMHPDRFCSVISGLASRNEWIGFDPTIFGDRSRVKIRTLEPEGGDSERKILYTIRTKLFQFPSLVGRGTRCWLTSGPEDVAYVVKDAWIAPSELVGKESEGSLLRHAQMRGVIAGIAQLRHFEEVRCGTSVSDVDTVLRNRRLQGTSPEERKVERIHTRIVLTTYGKPLDEFSTRMELLLAFHDAVLGHRQLHEVAGVLHRDVSVRNILIDPNGREGDRGILIDFDHSIRVDDTSPYSTKTKIGTWRYMSRNVLNEEGPHTYLDDLESFFYVLVWILVAFKRPGKVKKDIPDLVSYWDDPNAPDLKHGHFMSEFKFPVNRWFGPCFRDLAASLFRFFKRRRKLIGKPLSALNPRKDYDDFLSHVRQCIADMEKENPETDDHPPSSPGRDIEDSHPAGDEVSPKRQRNFDPGDGAPRKRRRNSDLAPPQRTKRRAPAVPRPTTPPGLRPRRSKANYGEPPLVGLK